MDQQSVNDIQRSYDRVASEYTRRIADELEHKPFDRAILQYFAEEVRAIGQICDIGTGPGHVARFLHACGVDVCGVDFAPEMIAQARRLNPEITFSVGDMRSLDLPDQTLGGIAAFYSLIHIPRDQIISVLTEFYRVLRPGGSALVAFHIGQDTVHFDEWWDMPVRLDFEFFQPSEMSAWLQAAGYVIEVTVERAPYPDVEHPSQRAYLVARKKSDHAETRS